jgi:hypothetical protein
MESLRPSERTPTLALENINVTVAARNGDGGSYNAVDRTTLVVERANSFQW